MFEKYTRVLVKDDEGHTWYYPWAEFSKKSYRIDDPTLQQNICKKTFWITFLSLFLLLELPFIFKSDLALLYPPFISSELQFVLNLLIFICLLSLPSYYFLTKRLIIGKLPADTPLRLDSPNMLIHFTMRQLITNIVIIGFFIGFIVISILRYSIHNSISWLLIALSLGVAALAYPLVREVIRRRGQK